MPTHERNDLRCCPRIGWEETRSPSSSTVTRSAITTTREAVAAVEYHVVLAQALDDIEQGADLTVGQDRARLVEGSDLGAGGGLAMEPLR